MNQHISHKTCPSCGSYKITRVLQTTDHTVSKETFEIWQCGDCGLRFTQNIPEQEAIGRYYQSENYISHTDTNKGIINRLYRAVRRLTLRSKRSVVQSATGLKNGTLLDLGAGTGAFASFMHQSGWKVAALEPDEQARKKAIELYSLQLDEPSKLFEYPENSFDAITLWHVIEHVHALHPYFQQLKKIIKPGGRIFLAVPNYTSDDAQNYKQFWAAYDTPRHLYHFSPQAMRGLITAHELELLKTKPMWFDSFYVSLLSEKYRSGQSNLIRGFWNGAMSNFKAVFNKEKASSLIYILTK